MTINIALTHDHLSDAVNPALRHLDELRLAQSSLGGQCILLLPVILYALQESIMFVPKLFYAGCSCKYVIYLKIMQKCETQMQRELFH